MCRVGFFFHFSIFWIFYIYYLETVQKMVVEAPPEGYLRMIEYGVKKAKSRHDRLFLQSVMAGIWVGVFGHACAAIGGKLYYPEIIPFSPVFGKLLYGLLFPGGFVAIVWTGSELFTGNTMTMIMYVFSKNFHPSASLQLLRVWTFSLVGNFIGTLLYAFFVTFLSGQFQQSAAERSFNFLCALCEGKMNQSAGAMFLLGVGCNCLVCLATWICVITKDGAGKVLAMWFCIAVFVVGGYEHIIANFYTLMAGKFVGCPHIGLYDLMLFNWLPTLAGNIFAGAALTGTVWFYVLQPLKEDHYSVLSSKDNSDRKGQAYGATDPFTGP